MSNRNHYSKTQIDESLAAVRRKIDAIDLKLLKLLNQRAHLALRVGELKAREGRAIIDRRREAYVLRQMRETNAGPLSEESIRRIFRQVLRDCRNLQGDIIKRGARSAQNS